MSETEKVSEWARFFKASPPSYRAYALIAPLEIDGEKMLQEVCKVLGLKSAADLVKACR